MAKCVNNRNMHMWSNEHTLAWLDDETTKPSKHTCSTWLIDGVSYKRETRGWSFIDWDDTCATTNVTPCVSVTNAFIANTASTYEFKTFSMTRTWLQVWLRHQHAETWMQWTRKSDVKTHTSLQSEHKCVQSSSETLQGRLRNWCRPKFWRVIVATTMDS